MSARFGDYELVDFIDDFGGGRGALWLARGVDGELCELFLVEPSRDDVDEAFFRGEDLPRLRSLGALDDVRFAKPIGEPLRFDNQNALRFAHVPFVHVDELRERARADGGIALPLVATLVRDVMSALVVAHAKSLVGLEWYAVAVDGRVRVFDTGESLPSGDLRRVGALCASLAFGGGVPRDGIPVRFTSALAWMLQGNEAGPPPAAILEWLNHDELQWTKWTPEQVVAELRALFPDLESRR
jgi:hypothetical protein